MHVVCYNNMQVHLISPLFVSRVISKLVEITAHEMLVLLMEIEVFSRNGSLHVRLIALTYIYVYHLVGYFHG